MQILTSTQSTECIHTYIHLSHQSTVGLLMTTLQTFWKSYIVLVITPTSIRQPRSMHNQSGVYCCLLQSATFKSTNIISFICGAKKIHQRCSKVQTWKCMEPIIILIIPPMVVTHGKQKCLQWGFHILRNKRNSAQLTALRSPLTSPSFFYTNPSQCSL